jgi:CDP-4-dehydro-6-deoxyglucose reductase
MDDNTMLEKVQQIKLDAFKDRGKRDVGLPSTEMLLARLEEFSQVLLKIKKELNQKDELLHKMLHLCQTRPVNLEELQSLGQQISQQLQTATTAIKADANVFVKDTFLRLIAAQVKFLPSGHEFFVEGEDSLLVAAIQAGYIPNHGCANGNCGRCKARLAAGKIKKIHEHDYVLSQYETRMGYFLMCANTAITDVVVEADEARSVADLAWQKIRAQVRKIDYPCQNLAVVSLQTPKTKTLRFMAGQWVNVELENGATATLPLASCPCDGRNLQWHVKREAHDFNQNFFSAEPSQTVLITGPQGEFVLSENHRSALMFVVQNAHFAHAKSLIEHAISIDTAASFDLYWQADDENGHYFNNLCRSWQDALGNFSYHALDNLAALSQQLNQDLAVKNHYADVYIAGDVNFCQHVRQWLKLQWPAVQFKTNQPV